ncbi:MAG: FeoB small GTPase domain-containing protein [Candidatus Anammoxibacter sp.]
MMHDTSDNEQTIIDDSSTESTVTGKAQITLVGNANVGKSVIFGLITGKYVIVSNYPGTTVEVSRGGCKGIGGLVEVVDTPGVNGLIPLSEDERVTRDILIEDKDKVVIQVADSKNLKRALVITTQLAELKLKVILAMNMWDESMDRGIVIDTNELKKRLGIQVVKTVATQKKGINTLINSAHQAAIPKLQIDYGEVLEKGIEEIGNVFEENDVAKNRGITLMFLAEDVTMDKFFMTSLNSESYEKILEVRSDLQKRFNEPLNYIITKKRAKVIDEIADDIIKPLSQKSETNPVLRNLFLFLIIPLITFGIGYKLMGILQFAVARFANFSDYTVFVSNIAAGLITSICVSGYICRKELKSRNTISDILGKLTMNPAMAPPLLIVILWLTYKIVGEFGAGTCVDFIESIIFGDASVPSGGFDLYLFIPFTDLRFDITHVNFQGINYYIGLLFSKIMSRENIIFELFLNDQSGLIRVGLTYSIAIVFPIVGFFFLIFGLMEDSGYLPRLAIMMDRILKKIGLNGKAVLPLILGLGCATMATLTTRILDTKKERTIAILLLALAIPCSAQLGVIASVLGSISGFFLLIYALVIFSQLMFVGYLASKILKGKPPDFMIEMPPFRFPKISNVIVKTIYRIQWFMKEAIPLFVLGTLILFITTKLGLLTILEKLGEPIVNGILGLPATTAQGFILGFLRRDYGAVSIFKELEKVSDTGTADPASLLVALVVITLFVPCLANFFIMLKEQGSKKAFLMVAFILPFSILVGGVLRLVLNCFNF